jgi:hypothetical protein
MAIKTILVAASGGTATDGTIELACHLRSAFEPISKAITCCSIRRLHSRRWARTLGLV